MEKLGNKSIILRIALFAIICVTFIKCDDPEITTSTTEDVVIKGYFEKHPEEFSSFLKILELSGNSGFLGAYGTYTCFAPTNEAVSIYLQEKGIASVESLDLEELKRIVRFHVIEDTISTSTFTDGKLAKPTMYGQYLITGAANIEGSSFIRVNRQANIVRSNISTANGIIHAIDRVLKPASLTIAKLIEQDPEYSIFLEALQRTKLYKLLDTVEKNPDGSTRWYTVIAQKNEVFAADGLFTYDNVETRYSQTDDPSDPTDSLYLYVSYRILPGIKYLADLITAPSHPTQAPLEVITTRLAGQSVLVNADFFNGVQEPGAILDRPGSDYSATNGVLHSSLNNYAIKIRVPYPIYWDVADQPELRLMTNDFRKPGKTVNIPLGTLNDVTWGGSSTNVIQYITQGATSSDQFVWGDRLNMNVRTGVIPWIEFTTPLLVKGKYKVWVCYRRQNYNDMQAFFNDVPLPRVFGLNPGARYPSGVTVDEAEAQGWKLYTGGASTNWPSRLLGTIEVKTTDRHKFKIVGLTNRGGSTGSVFWLDMIHFIPIDQDQAYPRFNVDGTQVERP